VGGVNIRLLGIAGSAESSLRHTHHQTAVGPIFFILPRVIANRPAQESAHAQFRTCHTWCSAFVKQYQLGWMCALCYMPFYFRGSAHWVSSCMHFLPIPLFRGRGIELELEIIQTRMAQIQQKQLLWVEVGKSACVLG